MYICVIRVSHEFALFFRALRFVVGGWRIRVFSGFIFIRYFHFRWLVLSGVRFYSLTFLDLFRYIFSLCLNKCFFFISIKPWAIRYFAFPVIYILPWRTLINTITFTIIVNYTHIYNPRHVWRTDYVIVWALFCKKRKSDAIERYERVVFFSYSFVPLINLIFTFQKFLGWNYGSGCNSFASPVVKC